VVGQRFARRRREPNGQQHQGKKDLQHAVLSMGCRRDASGASPADPFAPQPRRLASAELAAMGQGPFEQRADFGATGVS
jgi:hypothetical protein